MWLDRCARNTNYDSIADILNDLKILILENIYVYVSNCITACNWQNNPGKLSMKLSYKVWMVFEHGYIAGLDVDYYWVKSVHDQCGCHNLIRRQETARRQRAVNSGEGNIS